MKKPTDKALIKGFDDFEKGFNVLLAFAEHGEAGSNMGDDDGPDITPTHAKHVMWQAHEVYRRMAIAAQHRIYAKEQK